MNPNGLRKHYTPKEPEPVVPDKHVCQEGATCTCSSQSLDPNEECPVHGAGLYPKRCYICGKFLKQPEPAEQVTNWEYGEGGLKQEPEPEAIRVPGFGYIPKGVEPVVKENFTAEESKGGDGLVSIPVESFGEYWCVGTTFLDAVFSMVTFHHIELQSGATVMTLQAFSKDDPPIRAWFRETT